MGKKRKYSNVLMRVMDDYKMGVLKDNNGNRIVDQNKAVAFALNKSGVSIGDLRRAELKNKLIICKAQLEDILTKEIDADKQIRSEIVKLFRIVQMPTDKDVHGLADRLGISAEQVENVVYSMLRSFVAGGKSKGKESDFDAEEIKMGMIVEAEHTADTTLRKKIVYDHLTENPKYYSEGKAKGMFPELVNKSVENIGGKKTRVHVKYGEGMKPKGARMLQHVYESCRKSGKDKTVCAKQAWASVKRAGYKSQDEEGDYKEFEDHLENQYAEKCKKETQSA